MTPEELERIRRSNVESFMARNRERQRRAQETPDQVERLISIVHDLSVAIAGINERLDSLESRVDRPSLYSARIG
jgi:hypothetical protein